MANKSKLKDAKKRYAQLKKEKEARSKDETPDPESSEVPPDTEDSKDTAEETPANDLVEPSNDGPDEPKEPGTPPPGDDAAELSKVEESVSGLELEPEPKSNSDNSSNSAPADPKNDQKTAKDAATTDDHTDALDKAEQEEANESPKSTPKPTDGPENSEASSEPKEQATEEHASSEEDEFYKAISESKETHAPGTQAPETQESEDKGEADEFDRAISAPPLEPDSKASFSPAIARAFELEEQIVDLQQENDDLKDKIVELENKVKSLEAELARANSNAHDDDFGMTPPAPSHVRVPDLYSEQGNVAGIRQSMQQYKEFRMDLRSWSNLAGNGEIYQL